MAQPCFRVSHRLLLRFQLGLQLSSGSAEEGSTSKLMGLLVELSSTWAVSQGLQFLAGCWLEVILCVLPCGPLSRRSLLHQPVQASKTLETEFSFL